MSVEDIKIAIKQRFPLLYSGLSGVKHSVESLEKFPKIIRNCVGGIRFDMLVRSKREKSEVVGRYFEKYEIKTVLYCLREGYVFLDIGSSTGTYTLPAAKKCGESGSVIAVDPDKETVSALKHNISINNLKNVTTLPVAISDCDAQLILHSEGLVGNALRIVSEVVIEELELHTKVCARSVESLVKNCEIRHPDVIKIDVEGHAIEVIDGLGDVSPKHIFMEIHPGFGEDVSMVYSRLFKKGYVIIEKPRMRGEELHVHFQLETK